MKGRGVKLKWENNSRASCIVYVCVFAGVCAHIVCAGGGGGGGDGARFVGRNFHELPRLSDGPCSRLY